MHPPQEIPKLLTFYFGDSAAHAYSAASRRLKKWSRAFDQWTAGLRQDYRQDTLKHALLAWRRLARQSGKMPWQLSPSDIDHHALWLKQEGFAVTTVNASLGFIAAFYQWCADHRVDSACPPGFNPAKATSRTSLPRYAGVTMWSLDELDALLALLHRDSSPLGKRDYAFFLTRLNLGVPLKSLQRLAWGQIEQDGACAWVKWRIDGQRVRLPDQVWQALMDYLRLCGRLESMSAEKYILAPQVQPVVQGSGRKVEDWLEHQPLSSSALLSSLKLYGRQLGIPEPKLTLMALRRTAIRLRLDQGESLESMQVFMDTREKIKSTKYRLARLPGLPAGNPHSGQIQGMPALLPLRQTTLLVGGEGTTHGFYARRTDVQAVRAVIAENIHGMEGEIACLRMLMRLLLERDGDEARLVEAYSQAAQRLSSLVSAREQAHTRKQDNTAEEFLSRLDEIEISNGRPPISPGILEDALGWSSPGGEAFGPVTEEIATIRLLLRNVYSKACQAVDTGELSHLLNLYGLGCVRLARLLKLAGTDGSDRLERYLREGIDEAIRQVHQELCGNRKNNVDQ
jgi:integrase